jgi:hypothetical protein
LIYRKRAILEHQDLSQEGKRVRKNVGYVENMGISRGIVGKDRKHPKRTS